LSSVSSLPSIALALVVFAASWPIERRAVGHPAITVQERFHAVMLVEPASTASTAPMSRLFLSAAQAFDSRTGLALTGANEGGFDAERLSRCKEPARLSCWVNELRSTTAIFVVEAQAGEGGRDRLSAMLIDVARAVRCFDLGEAARTERCIRGRVAESAPVEVETGDREKLDAYFDSLLSLELKPMLESLRAFEPFGRVVLLSDESGDPIELDDLPIGWTSTAATHIQGLRPGKRRLRIIPRYKGPIEIAVFVKRGRTATVSAQLFAVPEPPRDTGRRMLLIAGGGAAVGGVMLGAISLAATASVKARCFVAASNPNAPCGSLGDPTVGFRTGGLPTADRDAINPASLPIAPLAVALFAAGVAWAGAALFGDASEAIGPIEIGGGALAAGAAFVVTALVDRR
jgi:hypothetical protein